jgi:hypothetical protein
MRSSEQCSFCMCTALELGEDYFWEGRRLKSPVSPSRRFQTTLPLLTDTDWLKICDSQE